MIKLVEIVKANQNNEYFLREISVNPNHIISIRDSDKFIILLAQNQLPKGLNNNHQFIEVSLSSGNSIIAVGTPQIINEKIKSAKKLLLG